MKESMNTNVPIKRELLSDQSIVCKKQQKVEMADWSKLQIDILYDIVMRLETIEDFVYFSVVCRSWNHFASTVKHEFNVKTMPWLLLAENTKDNPNCLRKVFNPSNNKCYQFKLPETFGCRCWGSAYGWLVTYNQDLELHLFNPLTKARLSLPPISSLPYQWERYFSHPDDDYSLLIMRSLFIRKAFVIEGAKNDFIVFVSYYMPWDKLAFARPSDQSWTSIDDDPRRLVSLKGANLINSVHEVLLRCNQILILYKDASLGYLDISDLSDPRKRFVKDCSLDPPLILSDPPHLVIKNRGYIPSPPGILDEFCEFTFGSDLVYSCGDVFMVLRDRGGFVVSEDENEVAEDEVGNKFGKDDYSTFGFLVYQLDFDNKNWFQVHHIGDVNFFVGSSSSMSVPSNNKANCIIYSDDFDNELLSPSSALTWGGDMGGFQMGKGELFDICDGCDRSDRYSKVQTPLWFMPGF